MTERVAVEWIIITFSGTFQNFLRLFYFQIHGSTADNSFNIFRTEDRPHSNQAIQKTSLLENHRFQTVPPEFKEITYDD